MRFQMTTALLAVGIVATLSTVHATGGYCPDPRVMRIACDGSRTVEKCTQDSECSTGKKCCPSPCGWTECFVAGEHPPPNPKNGECEPHRREVTLCAEGSFNNSVEECTNDWQCPGDLKCCEQACVKNLCKPPVVVREEKEGVCMAHALGCGADEGPDPIECDTDSDCKGALKCCSTRCFGRKCQRPDPSSVPQKDGQCVRVPWELIDCAPMPIGAQPNCTSDFECPGEQKCCDIPCAPQGCRDPAIVKPGQCMAHIMGCPAGQAWDPINCDTDEECDGDFKCCSTACFGRNCQSPDPTSIVVSQKDGECERVEWERISCLPIPSDVKPNCTNDFECPGEQKCCDYPCAPQRCRDPAKKGMCPDFTGVKIKCPEVQAADECQWDSDCTGALKCCRGPCGNKACWESVPERNIMPPPPGKEGYCEDFSNIRALCIEGAYDNSTEDCKTDMDCSGSNKCCPQLCVKPLCKAPLKLGRCPMTIQGCQGEMPGPRNCENDYDCTGENKCCTDGCGGSNCVTPDYEEREGECPVFKCQEGLEKVDQCSQDGVCPAGMKCCNTCTGKRCWDAYVPPPTVKEGECVRTLEACLNTTNRPEDECKTDGDCKGSDKCCEQSCGNMKCVPAMIIDPPAEKPGVCIRILIACMNTTGRPDDTCQSDYQCNGTEKCCEQPCGNRLCAPAHNPPTVHPGECPASVSSGPVGHCAIMCETDANCVGGRRCCSNGCGRECMDTGDAGHCPRIMGCPNSCIDDSSCPTTSKCCSNYCGGKQCIDLTGGPDPQPEPQPQKFECPYFDAKRVCIRQGDVECNTTLCDDGSPCCPTECGGTKCGRDLCPVPDPNVACVMMGRQECNSTNDCSGDSICCSTVCGGRSCIKKAHPGSCPNTQGTIGLCAITCHGDYKCAHNEKCCTNGCGGTQCMAAVGGEDKPQQKSAATECPVFNHNASCTDKRYPYLCDPKKSCTSDGLSGRCCEYECSGTRCMTDLCPAPKNIQCFQQESRDCETTADCRDESKICCGIHCGGTRCLPKDGSSAPETGLCPAPQDIQCVKQETRDCETTADCNDDTKICCGIHCGGTRCLPKNGTSPGNGTIGSPPSDGGVRQVQGSGDLVCPAPASKPKCDGLSRRSCTDDSTCGNKKCCASGCENINICITPVRQGKCPYIDPSTIRCAAPTEKDKANACGTDMGCPGKQKCCPNACPGYGARCVDPGA